MTIGDKVSWPSINGICYGIIESEENGKWIVRLDNGKYILLQKELADIEE